MKKITIKSPAKINLTLDIFSKKPEDDFHEIKTIFHRIDFGDVLEISKNDKFEIVGNFDFPMKKNLIFKAWKLIEEFVEPKNFHPVKIIVEKNIPEGGGLGGGSSNFANFIKGYFELFDLGEVPEDLISASAEYGKDIPFFFWPDPCAVGRHFGEVIEKTPFDPAMFSGKRIYLYIPEFESPTAEMYKKLTNLDTNFTDNFLKDPDLNNGGNGFNEFLKDERYHNLLSKEVDIRHSALVISGSGSCFFCFEKFSIKSCETVDATL